MHSSGQSIISLYQSPLLILEIHTHTTHKNQDWRLQQSMYKNGNHFNVWQNSLQIKKKQKKNGNLNILLSEINPCNPDYWYTLTCKQTVWCECLFPHPISDIEVLTPEDYGIRRWYYSGMG